MQEAPNLPTRFGQPKGTATLTTDQGRINNHIKPLLGKRRVGDVTAADVRRFLRNIAARKTAKDLKAGPRKRLIVKGGRGAATRVTGLLSGIFSFAVAEGIRSDNPVKGVQRYADGKSGRALSLQEITKLGFVLRRLTEQDVNPSAINIAPDSFRVPLGSLFTFLFQDFHGAARDRLQSRAARIEMRDDGFAHARIPKLLDMPVRSLLGRHPALRREKLADLIGHLDEVRCVGIRVMRHGRLLCS